MNNIIGLKPTKGTLSTKGFVPCCPSLDCPSVFALSVKDALEIAHIAFSDSKKEAEDKFDLLECCFLELANPLIPTAIRDLAEKGVKKITVEAIRNLKEPFTAS